MKRYKKNIIIAMLCALVCSLIYLTTDCQVETIRNGEEYCDTFWDGQVFEQELMIEHTPKLHVDILPTYAMPSKDVGVSYTLWMGEKYQSGFLSLLDYPNNEWTTIEIPIGNFSYVGRAILVLEAQNLDTSNTLQFLITTNGLQLDADCNLYKNNQLIENGRLNFVYQKFKLEGSSIAFVISFFVSLVLSLTLKSARKSIRKYPMAYLASLLFVINVIAHFQTIRVINKHVSAQYFFSWQSLGFVRRALAGTVIEFLGLDFNANSYRIYGVVSIALIILLELYILYNGDNTYRSKREQIFLLFLCTPLAVTTFFGNGFFARFDQLLIALFLMSCIVIIKEQMIPLVLFFSVSAILIHEMYLALFVPFVFCLLLYKWCLTKEYKYMVCLISTSVISLATGIYISIFAKAKIPFEIAWENIQNKGSSDLIWDWVLAFDHYTSPKNQIYNNLRLMFSSNLIPKLIISIVFLLPLVLLIGYWLKIFFLAQEDWLAKSVVALFPCTLAGAVISLYAACDWGRFLVMYGIGIVFSFFTLWSMDTERVTVSLTKVEHFAKDLFGQHIFKVLCVFYMWTSTYENGASFETLFQFFNTLF